MRNYPDKDELRETRQEVENAWKSFEHSVDTENPEFFLSWQRFDRAASLTSTEDGIMISVNPEKDPGEEIRESVLLGLLEREFREKAPYSDLEFDWQDIAKMTYVKKRRSEITDAEFASPELTVDWNLLREEIASGEEFSQELYENASVIASRIAEEKLENAEEVLEFTRSDILELGDEVFG